MNNLNIYFDLVPWLGSQKYGRGRGANQKYRCVCAGMTRCGQFDRPHNPLPLHTGEVLSQAGTNNVNTIGVN